MQNKMINHIFRGAVTREDNLLIKIKAEKTLKKGAKRSKSKPKLNINEVFEEYKFIATDYTLPYDKEELKATYMSKNHINFQDNDIIKVNENAFINDSKLFNNNNFYDEQNLNLRLSKNNEQFYKSSREG